MTPAHQRRAPAGARPARQPRAAGSARATCWAPRAGTGSWPRPAAVAEARQLAGRAARSSVGGGRTMPGVGARRGAAGRGGRDRLDRHGGPRHHRAEGGRGRACGGWPPSTTSPGWPTGRCSPSSSTQASLAARRPGRPVAVLFCDLDRFKEVNDRHGHAVGDAVLVTIADRLQEITREGDMAARVGGDEFVILCEGVTDSDVAGHAGRADHRLDRPPDRGRRRDGAGRDLDRGGRGPHGRASTATGC